MNLVAPRVRGCRKTRTATLGSVLSEFNGSGRRLARGPCMVNPQPTSRACRTAIVRAWRATSGRGQAPDASDEQARPRKRTWPLEASSGHAKRGPRHGSAAAWGPRQVTRRDAAAARVRPPVQAARVQAPGQAAGREFPVVRHAPGGIGPSCHDARRRGTSARLRRPTGGGVCGGGGGGLVVLPLDVVPRDRAARSGPGGGI